ncbi:MAG: SagB/ThcOx family dehydrogenase [Acholeplasmataceae bacterium]
MKIKHIAQEFLDQSTHQKMERSDQSKGLTQPPLQMAYTQELIHLPQMSDIDIPNIDLKTAMMQRVSVRSYPNKALSLESLSYLLYMTQGVKSTKDNKHTLRVVPSAGARHAFETYIVIKNVEGLKPGLYRYLALEHKLICLKSEHDFSKKLRHACFDQISVDEASVTLIWVADQYRMTYRYGLRGYRYLFLDAGHVSQNAYLVAQQLGCGACAINAFDDEQVNALLALDGIQQFAIHMATIGHL